MQKLHVVVFINILKVKKIYFGFILNKHFKQMNKEIKNNIIEANGDIFKIFISMYDCMENNFAKEEDIKLYKKIFENLKTSEDSKIFKNS